MIITITDILNHWIWQDKPFAKGQAYMDLLLLSANSQSHTIFRNSIHKVESGQIVTSENELCKRWEWSRTKLRSFLKLLEEASMIELTRDKSKTLITIFHNPVISKSNESKNQPEKPNLIQGKTQEKRQEEKQLKPAQKQAISTLSEQEKRQVKEQKKITYPEVSHYKKTNEPYQLTILDGIEREKSGEKQ